jgi:hypothetical protein
MTDAAFDDFDMAAARAKFSAKVDGSKGARRTRQRKTTDAVDGRSLRATGRTEHLNFKATPRIKQALAKHVPKGKTSLWLEEAIIEKLQREGIDIDA